MGATERKPPEGDRVRVKGQTFWRAASGGREMELTSETGIELDADRCRWTVIAPGGAAGVPVESRSREVHRFMLGVVEQMHHATRQALRRPVPKPSPKPEPPMPAGAPVSCPLCRGEAWYDCELCDGEGVVTQRRAAEWGEMHDA